MIQIIRMKIYQPLWPCQIGQGRPSLCLALSFIIWITGINMEAIHTVGVEISRGQSCILYQPV